LVGVEGVAQPEGEAMLRRETAGIVIG